jgi:rare lipoprotein A
MANGKPLNMNTMIAAHPTYPLGTVVRVTNLKNNRSARLRIEDRGPARAVRREGVIIDVSLAAAKALDFVDDGRVPVRVEVLRWGTES